MTKRRAAPQNWIVHDFLFDSLRVQEGSDHNLSSRNSVVIPPSLSPYLENCVLLRTHILCIMGGKIDCYFDCSTSI
jgi:hypothetical protein